MKVYGVFGGYDWEGEDLISIHATREGAEQRAEQERHGEHSYDSVRIAEYEVEA